MTTLPKEKLEEIRENFEYFDRNNKGYINFEEFSELLAVISPQSTTRQAAEGFSMIDTNSDGHVDLDEFVEWWQTTWYEY